MGRKSGLACSIFLLSLVSHAAIGQENCNSALTRIGRRAIEKAIADHQTDACSGLSFRMLGATIGIDKTKKLELVNYRLCENGPIVNGAVTVRVQCATSDHAVKRVSKEDDLTATASANLDTCQIEETNITGGSQITQLGLNLANVNEKFRREAEKQIRQFCR